MNEMKKQVRTRKHTPLQKLKIKSSLDTKVRRGLLKF